MRVVLLQRMQALAGRKVPNLKRGGGGGGIALCKHHGSSQTESLSVSCSRPGEGFPPFSPTFPSPSPSPPSPLLLFLYPPLHFLPLPSLPLLPFPSPPPLPLPMWEGKRIKVPSTMLGYTTLHRCAQYLNRSLLMQLSMSGSSSTPLVSIHPRDPRSHNTDG